ncbi:ORFh [Enterobacteria phage PR772]|uniref:ORFh n=1 Tax=Enterobacteria phage PR772 TaxID=261665 RepID=Q6EDW9_9VIRU|nr:ORFh [Enterobacteria phage PR772]
MQTCIATFPQSRYLITAAASMLAPILTTLASARLTFRIPGNLTRKRGPRKLAAVSLPIFRRAFIIATTAISRFTPFNMVTWALS